MNHSIPSNPPGATPPRSALLPLPAAIVLSFGLITSGLVAQPGGPGGPDGPGGPPAGFAFSDFGASYSFSADADLSRGGKLGSAEISHYDFEASFSLPAPDTWRLSSSISWSRDEFKFTGTIPLPKQLESFGFGVMAMKDLAKEIGPGWSAMAMLNADFSSDTGKISGDSFSLMAVAMIGKEVSPNFEWQAGLIGKTRGDMKVFPMIGLRWKFAPDWSLLVGFPRTGISYQASEALTLTAGLMGMQGGTYYVSESTVPGLNKTYLEYNEMRGGLRAEYQISKNFSVEADAGVTLDRKFDYYDLNYKLDGKSSGYGRIGLKYQF